MYIWTCEINAPIGSILLGQLGHEDLLCNGLLSYRVNFGLGGIMFYKKPFTCKVHTGNAPIRDLQGTRWPMKRSHIRNWWAYQFRRIENQPHNAICKLGGSKSQVKERERKKGQKVTGRECVCVQNAQPRLLSLYLYLMCHFCVLKKVARQT